MTYTRTYERVNARNVHTHIYNSDRLVTADTYLTVALYALFSVCVLTCFAAVTIFAAFTQMIFYRFNLFLLLMP